MYTDSHCHLAMVGSGADEALARARQAGVSGFVVPSTKLDDVQGVVDLAGRHPDVWAAVGFHPHEAKDFDQEARALVERLAGDPRVVAVGEIGLDYYYDHSPRETQRSVFIAQLEIARQKGLPVIIHNRDSTSDLLEILSDARGAGIVGVLHSFTESYAVATRLIDRGFFISFSGIVTFKSADALRDVAKRLPHDRVLIETDTPYLAPVPHRGKSNEPAYVLQIAELLGTLWNLPSERVGEITRTNFEAVFRVRIP